MASGCRGREAVALVAAYLVMSTAVPMIGRSLVGARQPVALSLVTVAVLMLVQMAIAASLASLGIRPRYSALFGLLCGALLAGVVLLIPGRPSLHLLLVSGLWSVRNLLLILVAVLIGYTVSFIVREPGMLVPVALVETLADFWNVVVGPLGRLVERSPEVISAFAVHVPSPVIGVPSTMVGLGDFVFLALYFGVLHRFALNLRGAFWLSYALLTVSMIVVMGWGLALPALVPLGVGVLLPNLGRFRLSRQELFATLYVGGVVALLLVAATALVVRT